MVVDWSRHMFALFFFFFNDTATTEIYTLSLHDALPISSPLDEQPVVVVDEGVFEQVDAVLRGELLRAGRSEEHTSELQSQSNLVCRLLLEKKKKRHQIDVPDCLRSRASSAYCPPAWRRP